MPVLLKVGSGLLDEGSKALDEMEEEARAAPLQVFLRFYNFEISNNFGCISVPSRNAGQCETAAKQTSEVEE